MFTVAFHTQKLVSQPEPLPLPLSSHGCALQRALFTCQATKQCGKTAAFMILQWGFSQHKAASQTTFFLHFFFISKQDFTVKKKKKKSQSTHRLLRNIMRGASKEKSSATLSIAFWMNIHGKTVYKSEKKSHQNLHIHQSLNYSHV